MLLQIMCTVCVLWVMYIPNIYFIYIYERFSDFCYGFGAGEFITEPNEAHTESVVQVQGIGDWFAYVYSAYLMQYPHCHVKSRTHKSEPAIFYL